MEMKGIWALHYLQRKCVNYISCEDEKLCFVAFFSLWKSSVVVQTHLCTYVEQVRYAACIVAYENEE